MTVPDVSLIFETENEHAHRHIRLEHNVAAWRGQSSSDRILEWIVVSKRPIQAEEERLLAGLPYRWLCSDTGGYYSQKNAGIAQSVGRFISLADADDRPESDWLGRAVEALEASPPDVAVVTGRTRYDRGPFSREMTIAHFPFQQSVPADVLTVGAGNSLFRGDVLRRLRFEGDHIRHGPDVDLAHRLLDSGLRVVYDPRLVMTHNYTDHVGELWGHVAMKGHAFALWALFRGGRCRHPVIDAVGRYRVLLRRLVALRKDMGLSLGRLPVSAAFYLWYVVAAGYGYARALRGDAVPAFRF